MSFHRSRASFKLVERNLIVFSLTQLVLIWSNVINLRRERRRYVLDVRRDVGVPKPQSGVATIDGVEYD
jgi:hypothetical protein